MRRRERGREWLRSNPEDANVLFALAAIVDRAAAGTDPGLDVESALRKVKAGQSASRVLSFPVKPGGAWWQSPVFRGAAVLVVGALGGALWLTTREPAAREAAVATRAYRAPVGKPDSVDLPDGSQVVLAPGSELRVPSNYGDKGREVRLAGQGWFSVRHDDAEAFVVRVEGAEIRDVGTVFTVRANGLKDVRVAVHEGAVLVRGEGGTSAQEVVLHEGDEAIVVDGALASTTRGSVQPEDAAWVSGRLRFRDVPLAEVAATLERWYGVKVRITDAALSQRKIATDVTGSSSVDSVVREIALAVGAEAVRRGDTVIVRPAEAKR
ncbi:MAG: FecR family protein [Gemmatimonadaceae bacterium]